MYCGEIMGEYFKEKSRYKVFMIRKSIIFLRYREKDCVFVLWVKLGIVVGWVEVGEMVWVCLEYCGLC